MSLTLDSTLEAAQNSRERQPLIEIKSDQFMDDIPFDGQLLTEETTDEQKPGAITHSSGRLCTIYTFGTDTFKYTYTDTDRMAFTTVSLNYVALGFGSSCTVVDATLCELVDGRVGLVYVVKDASDYYLRYSILSVTGSVVVNGAIASYDASDYEYRSPFVIKLVNNTYLLASILCIAQLPESGGTYSGSDSNTFYLEVTQDGSETTAYFKWKKNAESWSAPVQCTGGWQTLKEGVQARFISGQYWDGQQFNFAVSAAVAATGSIRVEATPLDGDTTIIGSVTYIWKDTLSGAANEVKIDPLSMEISLENLRCAIEDTTFEGTGEGVRYGNGTVQNPDISAVRSPDYYLTLTARTPGAAGNNITITVDGTRLKKTDMSGGADTVVHGMQGEDATCRLKKRTSSNFTTWSAEADISIANLTVREKEHCSLLQISNGDIFLWFNYFDDLTYSNIYYSISSNNGVTWVNAVKVTSYAVAGASGKHPVAVQKITNQMDLVFHEKRSALHMDEGDISWCGDKSVITDLTFDPTNRKLYAVSIHAAAGNKYLYCVVKIDVDTWLIENCWSCSTVPAFNSVFCAEHVWRGRHHGDRYLIPIGTTLVANHFHIAVLDGESDAITHYHFHDWEAYGVEKNVDWTRPSGVGIFYLENTWVDFDSKRLYCLMVNDYAYNRVFLVGYIDLTDAGPTYTFHEVFVEHNQVTAEQANMVEEFLIDTNAGYIIIGCGEAVSDWKGCLRVYNMSTGSLYKHYDVDSNAGFPYRGIRNCCYYNGKVYGRFPYESLYGEQDKRGLCEIDLASDAIVYHRPGWATVDDYMFRKLKVIETDKILISTGGYGMTLFDTSTQTWTQWTSETLPGLTPDEEDIFYPVDYDSTNQTIFTGVLDMLISWNGVVAFSYYGFLNRAYYSIGEYTTSWAFGSANPYVIGYSDYEAAVSLDPATQAMYAFWTSQKGTELSLRWDKEAAEFDVTLYVTSDADVVLSQRIDGSPKRLTFSVSHADKFDPYNLLSLWSIYLKKGRKITLRFGEVVSGVEYWQEMGTFCLTEEHISYERGSYPVMNVTCEDKRLWWEQGRIDVSPYYETTPKDIIVDLLTRYGNQELSDIDQDALDFDDACTIYQQFVNTPLKGALEKIYNRFGYFVKVTVNDKISAKKISDSNSVDHTYSGTPWLINFTPDDSFSDFVNRIVVEGETRDYIEVLFAEESVATKTGTVGWWGHKKTLKVYYSEDRSRRARYPRLNVLESVSNFNWHMGGGEEYISDTDIDEQWVEITIECPNLVVVIVTIIAAIIALAIACKSCDGYVTGWCGVCMYAQMALICVLFAVLASVANYQYEIHARPLGKERQSVQAVSEDLDLQNEINGVVVERRFTDELCYTVTHCKKVADFEMLITELQRHRIRLSKLAHLRDEEGDTIKIPHPETGLLMKVFVTDLIRKYRKASSSSGSSGHFLDEIEGWKL